VYGPRPAPRAPRPAPRALRRHSAACANSLTREAFAVPKALRTPIEHRRYGVEKTACGTDCGSMIASDSMTSAIEWSKELAMYRLISATPSPYARKVRIQLAEKNIPFELITEVPWDNDTQTPQFNPLEKLPVLICDDGETVYESRFVNEWVELKHPEMPLMPQDKEGILLTKRFEILSDGVCDACVLVFWERARQQGAQSAEWTARQLRKRDGGLREISRLLGDKPYCVGRQFTLADIAVGSLLGWLNVRMSEFAWRGQYPNLAGLQDRLEARPSFANTVPYAQVIRDKVV
jgi:glutathione S-transferase